MTEDQSCEEPTLELVSTCSEGKQLTDDKLILKVVANKRYMSSPQIFGTQHMLKPLEVYSRDSFCWIEHLKQRRVGLSI
uniref:Uncharacterized protein n=1 Tax=Manihot esculenta TaxID=3983 RepID=A0A2C9V206_MANES